MSTGGSQQLQQKPHLNTGDKSQNCVTEVPSPPTFCPLQTPAYSSLYHMPLGQEEEAGLKPQVRSWCLFLPIICKVWVIHAALITRQWQPCHIQRTELHCSHQGGAPVTHLSRLPPSWWSDISLKLLAKEVPSRTHTHTCHAFLHHDDQISPWNHPLK